MITEDCRSTYGQSSGMRSPVRSKPFHRCSLPSTGVDASFPRPLFWEQGVMIRYKAVEDLEVFKNAYCVLVAGPLNKYRLKTGISLTVTDTKEL